MIFIFPCISPSTGPHLGVVKEPLEELLELRIIQVSLAGQLREVENSGKLKRNIQNMQYTSMNILLPKRIVIPKLTTHHLLCLAFLNIFMEASSPTSRNAKQSLHRPTERKVGYSRRQPSLVVGIHLIWGKRELIKTGDWIHSLSKPILKIPGTSSTCCLLLLNHPFKPNKKLWWLQWFFILPLGLTLPSLRFASWASQPTRWPPSRRANASVSSASSKLLRTSSDEA